MIATTNGAAHDRSFPVPKYRTAEETRAALKPPHSLDQRLLGALGVLWSMAKPGEPKGIVAQLAADLKRDMRRGRVTDRMVSRLDSLKAVARQIKKNGERRYDEDTIDRLLEIHQQIVKECGVLAA